MQFTPFASWRSVFKFVQDTYNYTHHRQNETSASQGILPALREFSYCLPLVHVSVMRFIFFWDTGMDVMCGTTVHIYVIQKNVVTL